MGTAAAWTRAVVVAQRRRAPTGLGFVVLRIGGVVLRWSARQRTRRRASLGGFVRTSVRVRVRMGHVRVTRVTLRVTARRRGRRRHRHVFALGTRVAAASGCPSHVGVLHVVGVVRGRRTFMLFASLTYKEAGEMSSRVNIHNKSGAAQNSNALNVRPTITSF